MDIVLTVPKSTILQEMNRFILALPKSSLTFEIKGYQVTIKKINLLDILLDINTIQPVISVGFEVTKSTLLSDIKSDGEIRLACKTDFKIDKHWVLETKTSYLNHDWLEEPDLEFGLVQLPIKSLVDKMIQSKISDIEDQLDQLFKTYNKLDVYIRPWTNKLAQSFALGQINAQINAHLTEVTLQSIELLKNETYILMASVQMNPRIDITEKPQKSKAVFPSFNHGHDVEVLT